MPKNNGRKDGLSQIHIESRMAVIQMLNIESALSAAMLVHPVRQGKHLSTALEAAEEASRLLRSVRREARRLR